MFIAAPRRTEFVADDPVRTARRIDDTTIHLFQVVHEAGDFPRDWVVIDIDEASLTLATLDFDERRTLSDDAFLSGDFTPLTAGNVPIWGY